MEKLLETLVLAAFFGAVLKIIAHKIHVPTIITLLIGGIILGPYVTNLINIKNLGEGFTLIISICIGIILFEGGLSLEVQGYKNSPKIIRKLLSIGIIITWFTTALLAHFLLDFSIEYSLLIGSMIIVTGPTVISPLMQRIKVKQNLKHILNWEAVLIDPIGVFIAILCFEWVTTEGEIMSQLVDFSIRLLTGSLIGLTGGLLLYFLLKKRIIPLVHNITFTLSSILLIYFVSNYISEESGLLAVVVAGFTFGLNKPQGIKHIKHFKLELSEFALALIFVLLAANLNLEYFLHLKNTEIFLILFVVFLLRPLSIFICSINSGLSIKEKIFLSWIAPRGIVAASIASLFAIELKNMGNTNASFLEVFVYAVIILTVLIQGITAEPLSKLLKLKVEDGKGWLIVGAHRLSRRLAHIIEENSNDTCYLIDFNHQAVFNAKNQNLKAEYGDATVPEDLPTEILSSVRNLLVLTDNEDLNVQICETWLNFLPKSRMYRWAEFKKDKKLPGKPIWNFLIKPSQMSYTLKKTRPGFDIENINTTEKKVIYEGESLFTLSTLKGVKINENLK